tara:strand:+ start:699 stop:1028 length:330 start_codon:yes stop_codon:yes gene_type:complete
MPRIENRWTTGNLLALAGILIQILVLGGGGLWYASGQEGRIEAIAVAVQTVENRTVNEISQIRRDIANNSSRLQSVELNYGRMDERLISIQQLVVNIDRKLEQQMRTRP